MVCAAIRGKPEINGHGRSIRNHIAGNTTRNPYRVEALAIDKPIDLVLLWLISSQNGKHWCGGMDSVLPHPRAGGVSANSLERNIDARGAIAAAFNS